MKIVLFGIFFVFATYVCEAQNVFDSNDPIIRIDLNSPLGSPEHPDESIPGLQKWVSTPNNAVSTGHDRFDASSFKQYFININGAKVAFRMKFPKSFNNPDSASKRYPVNIFLHGGIEVGCPSNGGIYNNEKHLWIGAELFRDWADQGKFDGFLLFPQLHVTQGCFEAWGAAPAANYVAIISMIDSMAKYIRADIDRVIVDGLSGGGYGAWRMASAYPQRVAKIMPSAAAGSVANRAHFVHIPVWFATGGKDPDPSPAQAQYALLKMQESGADIRYTVFPERGHAVWFQHWAEPGFVDEWNTAHKANPLVFFQRSEFCTEKDVNTKLGITSGFYAYEWQRNGVTIASGTNGNHQVVDEETVVSFTGNEIGVKKYGTYRARFKRKASSAWSDWSIKPAVITAKSTTETLPIKIMGKHSRVLPAVDGSTTVPLTLAAGFANYQWYRLSDDSLVATTQIFNAPAGEYKARYEEQFGCGAQFSPTFTVVDANGTPKPDPATALTAVSPSQTTIRLSWNQGNGENGFEVYRSMQAGGPYQFVDLVAANAKTYTDTGLLKNTLYFYRVRAISATGASQPSNESTAKTLVDNQAPTAPSKLFYQVTTPTTVRLTWTASTDDKVVARYDIYVNGRKLYTAFQSELVVPHLDSLAPYTFVVRAVDAADNVSAPSNQVTYLPDGIERGDLPGVPSEPAAEAVAHNKISVTWADTTSNETAFEVVRSASLNGTYVPIATVTANKTNYVDSGLKAETKYYYRLRAINGNGESTFSVKFNATTLAESGMPEAPRLTGESFTNGPVTLTWEDVSQNETNYVVYRSQDNNTFTKIASLPANSNAYADADVTNLITYSYFIVGINNLGSGPSSDTIVVRAGNNAPLIAGLKNIYVKATTTVDLPFSVSDDAGETVSVALQNNPGFVSLLTSAGNYILRFSPGNEKSGTYFVIVYARDNYSKITSDTVSIFVGDQKTRSMLVSFGNSTVQAANEWNAWPSASSDGAVLNNLKDETNVSTAISITAVSQWDGISTAGLITGNNSGIVPDPVLHRGWRDTGATKELLISGLNPSKQYNLVFIGSNNEGITAEAEYTTDNQSARLDARYNTNKAATLSSLVPVNGQLSVKITRVGSGPAMFLNALMIQEYDASVVMLRPDNLYAEALDKSKAKIAWSDRTNNEAEAAGYELVRATDSLFTQDVERITLPANTTQFTNTDLQPDTKYWYAVRARNGENYSELSRGVSVNTPGSIVMINFNVSVANGPWPWNNLATLPLSNFTRRDLKNESGKITRMALTLEKEFNGEFTGGVVTGNNSGVVPDNVLKANYWLDKGQVGQFRLSGLNHGKKYRIGFIGSSSPREWFRGNYNAAYSVHNQTVYLNSWENSTKIVFIDGVAPDADGKVMLNFTTAPDGAYSFNAGIILHEYSFNPVAPTDTVSNPNLPDTTANPNWPDTTSNPNPPDTTVNPNPNPPDTTGNPNPPDTTGNPNPNPPDTTVNPHPPVTDTISVDSAAEHRLVAYPNPFGSEVRFLFNNRQATDELTLEIYDSYGRITYRRNIGRRPAGNIVIIVNTLTTNLRNGLYIAALKVNGKIHRSIKIVRQPY